MASTFALLNEEMPTHGLRYFTRSTFSVPPVRKKGSKSLDMDSTHTCNQSENRFVCILKRNRQNADEFFSKRDSLSGRAKYLREKAADVFSNYNFLKKMKNINNFQFFGTHFL